MSIDSKIKAAVDEVEKEIEVQVSNLAKETFDLSQNNVPIDTGELKASGSFWTDGFESFTIGYTADYAGSVHDPLKYPREKITVPYVMDIKRDFMRRIPSGKRVRVRKHKKTFRTIAEKPVKVNGNEWRTINVNETTGKGNPWIDDAWNQIYSMLDKEDKEIFSMTMKTSNVR